MPRSTTQCGSCPAARKKTRDTTLMRPLFLDEATAWPPPDLRTQRQLCALREAIAPYLCLEDLRPLAASGSDVEDWRKLVEGLPEEVKGFMNCPPVARTPAAHQATRHPLKT